MRERVMLRVMCDGCGKELGKGEEHHILKLEVFAAVDPSELTEADLDEDHLEAVSEILSRSEEPDDATVSATARHRFDLCSTCRTRFLRDPLGRESAPKLHFSKN
jgi:hypothetical protein